MEQVPTEERVACLDNDGTLWCERPSYVQLDFFVDTLRSRASEPDFVHTPEFDALLSNDTAAMGVFMFVMALPWVIKPLFVLLTDFVPLFGSRRRSYFLLATAVALNDRPGIWASCR